MGKSSDQRRGITLKRFQYWGPGGIKKWTNWFPCTGSTREPWQLKNKLKNEYKDE